MVDEQRDECIKNCEKIYDQYADLLADRYKETPERLDMEVKNSQIFRSRRKPETETLFYQIFNFPFSDLFGKKNPIPYG